ncbi:MAG: peptide chain release factor-like protein [Gemmataceae bacterium]|nr:peptide chain release factor-like protein [Gemmataceae bacterium]
MGFGSVTSPRAVWAGLSDAQLLAQCEVDTYRASGPGGQKRNKTSSAVRLRHGPSGLLVIAEESRSQHENKARALRRLRRAFWLQIREPYDDSALSPVRDESLRLVASPRSTDYWPAVAALLDALDAAAGGVRDAATVVGVTTANLIHFLQSDDRAWQAAGAVRARYGRTPLR